MDIDRILLSRKIAFVSANVKTLNIKSNYNDGIGYNGGGGGKDD